jgi:hypothetical protein
MNTGDTGRVERLAALASQEQDPQKLHKLIEEILRITENPALQDTSRGSNDDQRNDGRQR